MSYYKKPETVQPCLKGCAGLRMYQRALTVKERQTIESRYRDLAGQYLIDGRNTRDASSALWREIYGEYEP